MKSGQEIIREYSKRCGTLKPVLVSRKPGYHAIMDKADKEVRLRI